MMGWNGALPAALWEGHQPFYFTVMWGLLLTVYIPHSETCKYLFKRPALASMSGLRKQLIHAGRGRSITRTAEVRGRGVRSGDADSLQSVCLLIVPVAQPVRTTAVKWRTLAVDKGHHGPSIYHWLHGDISTWLFSQNRSDCSRMRRGRPATWCRRDVFLKHHSCPEPQWKVYTLIPQVTKVMFPNVTLTLTLTRRSRLFGSRSGF